MDLRSHIATSRQERLRLQEELEKAERALQARKAERESLSRHVPQERTPSVSWDRNLVSEQSPFRSSSGSGNAHLNFDSATPSDSGRLRRSLQRIESTLTDLADRSQSPPPYSPRDGLNDIVEENALLRKALSSSEEALLLSLSSSNNQNAPATPTPKTPNTPRRETDMAEMLQRQREETERYKEEADKWRGELKKVRDEMKRNSEARVANSMEATSALEGDKRRLQERTSTLEKKLITESNRADTAEEKLRSVTRDLKSLEKSMETLKEQLPTERQRRIAAEQLSEELGQTFVEREAAASQRESVLEKKIATLEGYRTAEEDFRRELQNFATQLKPLSLHTSGLLPRRILEASHGEDSARQMLGILGELVEAVGKFERDIGEVQRELDAANRLAANMKGNENILHARLQQNEEELSRLRRDAGERDRIQAELFASREKLVDEIQEMQNFVRKMETERDSAVGLARTIESSAKDLENSLAQSLRSVEKELADLKGVYAQTRKQNEELSLENDSMHHQVNLVKSVNAQLEGRDKSQTQELQKTVERYINAEEKIRNLTDRCNGLQIEGTQLSHRIVETQRKFEFSENLCEAKNREVADVRATLMEMEKALSLERSHRLDAERRCEEVARALPPLQHELSLLRDKVPELDHALGMERQKVAMLEMDEARLAQREKYLENQSQSVSFSLQEERDKNSRFQSRIEHLERDLKKKDGDYAAIIESLRRQIHAEQEQNESLNKRMALLSTANKALDSVEMNEKRYRQQIEDKENQFESESKLRVMAENRAGEAEKRVRELQQQLASAKESNSELVTVLSAATAAQREAEAAALISQREKTLAQQSLLVAEGRVREAEALQVETSLLMQQAVKSVGHDAARRRGAEERSLVASVERERERERERDVERERDRERERLRELDAKQRERESWTPKDVVISTSKTPERSRPESSRKRDWTAERARLEAAVLRLEQSKMQARMRDQSPFRS